jgi:hypothetical protein
LCDSSTLGNPLSNLPFDTFKDQVFARINVFDITSTGTLRCFPPLWRTVSAVDVWDYRLDHADITGKYVVATNTPGCTPVSSSKWHSKVSVL